MRCTIEDKENAYYPAGASTPRPGAFYQQEQADPLEFTFSFDQAQTHHDKLDRTFIQHEKLPVLMRNMFQSIFIRQPALHINVYHIVHFTRPILREFRCAADPGALFGFFVSVEVKDRY